MESLNTFTILSLATIILIWVWLRKKYSYWTKKGVATLPFSYIWGNTKELLFQRISFLDIAWSFYQGFKAQGLKYGGVYLTFVPMYVPVDLKIIKGILQVDSQHFIDRGMYMNEKGDPLSAHLFSLEGAKWKLLRQKLSPTFTTGKMKMMHKTLIDSTKGLYKAMDKELGNAVDIKDILGRFSTDAIGSCAFGLDCNSLENPDSEFRKKGKELFHKTLTENVKHLLTFIIPKFMRIINAKVNSSEVHNFFMNVVKDTVTYREKNNIFRKDFMHLLIQLKNRGQLVDDEKVAAENLTENENKITIEELAAQAFVFFEAGFETSSTTMTFCLYELAKNKDIQDKVRKEIEKILAKYNGQLTYDAAMDMHYLEQTINETLRKYPPLPSLDRICTNQYKVPGTDLVLEEGTRVIIPVIGIQRDPEFYPDPDKFDPDRFLEENKRKRPAVTFLPFGEGPRICIGARFGMMQTKVGLIALLINYEFNVNKKTNDPIKFDPASFVSSTKGGMWLDIKKISPQSIELFCQN